MDWSKPTNYTDSLPAYETGVNPDFNGRRVVRCDSSLNFNPSLTEQLGMMFAGGVNVAMVDGIGRHIQFGIESLPNNTPAYVIAVREIIKNARSGNGGAAVFDPSQFQQLGVSL